MPMVKIATKRTIEPQSEPLFASSETTTKISKTRPNRMEPAAIFAPKRTPQVVQSIETPAREAILSQTRRSNNKIQLENINMNETQEDCVNLKIDVSFS